MPKVGLGKKIPAVTTLATGDKAICATDLLGCPLVLFCYPKDSTPGCTQDWQDFRDNHRKFRRRKAVVLGVSRDSLNSHERFRLNISFPST